MHIEVELHPSRIQKWAELPPEATGLDLMRALSLAPDAHILIRGKEPIPEDEPLREGERIQVIAVVSGG